MALWVKIVFSELSKIASSRRFTGFYKQYSSIRTDCPEGIMLVQKVQGKLVLKARRSLSQ